jgi:NTP pyrophosphatase (non-canonical NTP hydrolase)
MDLKAFQELMRKLYYENDHQRGIHRTGLWLVEEVGELMREIKKTPEQMDRINLAEEMADIYAWVASLANLLEIDLDHAVQTKYPQECPKCRLSPCACKKNLP